MRQKCKTENLNGSFERLGPLAVARGQPAPPFDLLEGAFDQVPLPVDMLAVGPPVEPAARGGHGRQAGVGVVAPVDQDEPAREALNQFREMEAIRLGTSRDREFDRHTVRIHGQVCLGVGSPFVSPAASVPPSAPAPSQRAFMQVEFAISHSKSGSSMTASSRHSHTSLSRQRQKRLWAFFQPSQSGGRSRQGDPVHNIQNTVSMKCRLSSAPLPTGLFWPGSSGSMIDRDLSPMP